MTDKNDKPIVIFTVLKSVEDYVEGSGKFRTNCTSFQIPGRNSGSANAVYIPYCDKQRFDFGSALTEYRGQGIFTPPETRKRWQTTDFILFREHFHDIHCPQPCRAYRNKHVARLFALLKKPWSHIPATEKWTRKEIVTIVVTVIVGLGAAILGWVTPEGRRFLGLDKPQAERQISSPRPDSEPPKVPMENHPTTDRVIAVVKPPSPVDWHDKRNWRHYLQIGITRTDVRQIFGEPEKMSVHGDLEMWDYGSGRITFSIEGGTADGSLFSWDEPD